LIISFFGIRFKKGTNNMALKKNIYKLFKEPLTDPSVLGNKRVIFSEFPITSDFGNEPPLAPYFSQKEKPKRKKAE
jgi:hypothetical protein